VAVDTAAVVPTWVDIAAPVVVEVVAVVRVEAEVVKFEKAVMKFVGFG
jgi:hypothetical protein